MAALTSNIIVLGVLLFTAGYSAAAPQDADTLLSSAIAYRGQFPWQVALFRKADLSDISAANLLGSGALISNQYVLTSASAVNGEANVEALLGVVSLAATTNAMRVGVSKQMPHSQWNKETAENDIALLQLDGPIIFEGDSKDIAVIRLPLSFSRAASFVGQSLAISGWGSVNSVSSSGEYLSISSLQVIRNVDCQAQQTAKHTQSNSRMPWTMMCAVGAGPCKGDSGDPAVFLEADGIYTLVGIVSSDVQCESDKPSTLARVTMFLDWISDNSDVQTGDDTWKTSH